MIAKTTGVYLAYTRVFFETMKKSRPLSSVAGMVTKDALARALKTIKDGGADWFVYVNGNPQENRTEDEGRTEIMNVQGLPEKVYAILEDYGDPSTWDEIYEPETAETLRSALGNKRHKLTIMFASDY
ncbi:unnamed protein product [marine sediment metagenome]|uniref:Uncharacterized protein n=1 Tax=marine sediment metagenome TaxID=412755 RepID=X1STG3_9ZZZZ